MGTFACKTESKLLFVLSLTLFELVFVSDMLLLSDVIGIFILEARGTFMVELPFRFK